MAILHFYSINTDSIIRIDIMYICNQWCIKKTWNYQTSNESTKFKINDEYNSNIFIYDLIKCTYIFENNDVFMEITKDNKSLIHDVLDSTNLYNHIVTYLTYLKHIDRDSIDRLYKSYIVSNTKNILTKTFPQEIIDYIISFV